MGHEEFVPLSRGAQVSNAVPLHRLPPASSPLLQNRGHLEQHLSCCHSRAKPALLMARSSAATRSEHSRSLY